MDRTIAFNENVLQHTVNKHLIMLNKKSFLAFPVNFEWETPIYLSKSSLLSFDGTVFFIRISFNLHSQFDTISSGPHIT